MIHPAFTRRVTAGYDNVSDMFDNSYRVPKAEKALDQQ